VGETYEAAGVSIDAGDEAVRRIKPIVRSTFRPEVLGDIGGFGSLFALDKERWNDPVLVSSTDGVGTKALVARAAGRYDTIGIDLVAMCVDDLACQGAEPLFFLDYLAVGRLDPDQVTSLVSGIADGCKQAGCALIGGEMAEHPGSMEPGDFDMAGFAVGAVDRDRIITGEHVEVGDVLVGIPSTNLRSNGFSLVRRVLIERAGLDLDGPAYDGADHTLADELLAPSVIFAPAIAKLLGTVDVRAIAHITGGGIAGNVSRVLPPRADAVIQRRTWEAPRIFGEIQRLGGVSDEEMARVFNLGIGMVVALPASDVHAALDALASTGHPGAAAVGEIVAGEGDVRLEA
jgi:phosphoribosylformylglycinamidine cyclo-ligase